MAPAAVRRGRPRRQPLVPTSPAPQDQSPLVSNLRRIFNNSQHQGSSEAALEELKKLYKNTEFNHFKKPFEDCVKKLFQSRQSTYFKITCNFLCKFLQYVSKESDEAKAKNTNMALTENSSPTNRASRSKRGKPTKASKKPKKRAKTSTSDSEDELVAGFFKNRNTTTNTSAASDDGSLSEDSIPKSLSSSQAGSTVTDHDRLVSSCVDVAGIYLRALDEECRLNAVFFICKFLAHVEALDEGICNALKQILPQRIRDKKPNIRAQAVLASRTFQDDKLIQEAFKHHFYRDPELIVRKALLQIMDTKVFGYDFLVESTQDTHYVMRRAAYGRLNKISPTDLTTEQLHRTIHNGLNERDAPSAHRFRTQILWPWLSSLYDGLDLHELLQSFDIVNYTEDIICLLNNIYDHDLQQPMNEGTSTKLHHVVEDFRRRWLSNDTTCLPSLETVDETLVTVWFTLVRFCKENQPMIESIKVRTVQPEADDADESMEKILESQENTDEVVEAYERLRPDLVNLVEFLKNYINQLDEQLRQKKIEPAKAEFIYQQIMDFIATYEIGDELERKTVQEVFDMILRENLLIGLINNFIPPIIKCLSTLVYSRSSNLMINYISEMIQNVRSHLEDLAATSSIQCSSQLAAQHSMIAKPGKTPKSVKKVRIDAEAKRFSNTQSSEQLEVRIANIRVRIEELRDDLEQCIKDKDYEKAGLIDKQMSELRAEDKLLHERRCSIASDVSHLGFNHDNELLSSTMIGEVEGNLDDSRNEKDGQEKEVKSVFKHHANELMKCLQMYAGCLQNAKVTEVPETMLSHLKHLSYEALEDWYRPHSKIRSLMITCNGITALIDKHFALNDPALIQLLTAGCFDERSIDIQSGTFKCLVDVVCRYDDIEFPTNSETFLRKHLETYGMYNSNSIKKNELEFITVLIEGTTKLFYLQKLKSPDFFSCLIIWWYHPHTPSKLKQFIGIFLPTFVDDLMKERHVAEATWFRELLMDTFVISVEKLHKYILGDGYDFMGAADVLCLINFLSNLIPISLHPGIAERIDEKIGALKENQQDLLKYLKQSKSDLTLNQAPVPPPQPAPEAEPGFVPETEVELTDEAPRLEPENGTADTDTDVECDLKSINDGDDQVPQEGMLDPIE